MLRTMIGLGLVLILVLSYAVFSATVDSEYYRYETTNESVEYTLELESENESSWYVSTSSSPTWVNLTVVNAPNDAELIITSTSSTWFHSPLLGEDGDSAFNCKEFDEISDSCEEAYQHSMMIDTEEVVMRGRASLDLPINGVGYVRADDAGLAETDALNLLSDEKVTTTWLISIYVDGELVSPEGIELSFTLTEHELVSISEFQIDPVQETLYGIATLVGCFFLLIAVPMMVYFAGIAKARLDEENRLEDPAPNE
jgi:hypothetical protein